MHYPYAYMANLLLALSRFPYLKKSQGNGAMATIKNASRLDAHWKPSFSYIWIPKRGNAAEEHVRTC